MRNQLQSAESGRFVRFAVTLIVLALAVVGSAEDIKAAARAAVKSSSDAVVTIRMVLLISTPMGEQEDKVEVTGTVIDPSGLVVVPASAVDPTSMLQGLMSAMGPMGGGGNVDSDVKETVIIMADGTEVDAEMVLKDADLDLAFVRPIEAPEEPFTAMQLAPRDQAPDLLDDVFVISRLGSLENRSPAVTLGHIESIVKGPRTFYVCSSELGKNSLGCVAFDATGKAIGVFVTKQKPTEEDSGGGGLRALMTMMMGGGGRSENAAPVLRPVGDVLEVAQQALKAGRGADEGGEEEDGEDEGGEDK